MSELLSVVIHAARAAVRGRNDLILENLLLRQQLQVALRPKRRLSLRRRDRFLWVLVRQLRPDWRRYLLYVRPETVVRWHRSDWRLYWRWRSRTRLGRPRLSAEVRALIRQMASDNPLWGTERIRGELLKLGLIVSARSIRRYRRLRRSRPPSLAWRIFLRNELAGIWAADLLVVQPLTFKTLYVLWEGKSGEDREEEPPEVITARTSQEGAAFPARRLRHFQNQGSVKEEPKSWRSPVQVELKLRHM